ncbi:MAG: T9SS type A sorting domain-containing protein [bacterium]
MKILLTLKILLLLIFFFIKSTNSYCQLNGAYTIGSGGNYTTIALAVNDLISSGVSGPVVFNIITGTYDEQIIIDSVRGVSRVNTVTFRSQSGLDSSVYWTTNNIALNYILEIRSADYLIFKNINFQDNTTANNIPPRQLLKLQNICSGIQILNNVFNYTGSTLSQDVNDFIYSDSYAINLLIDGNSFFKSQLFNYVNGIRLISTSFNPFLIKISNNYMPHISEGISISNYDSVEIERNTISVLGPVNNLFFICINLQSIGNHLRVSKNILTSEFGQFPGTGFAAINIENCFSPDALISNNFIFNNSNYGIFLNNCLNYKFIYNSFYTRGLGSISFGILNSNSIFIRNNIYQNITDHLRFGYPYVLQNSQINSDYNNFFFENDFIAKLDTQQIHTLPDWINATGNDSNSTIDSVQFVSGTDLHLAGTSIGNENLIAIPFTEIPDDIDGNLRSLLYPYKGADEADIPLPVELTAFTSLVVNRDVTLNWQTSYERNNSGFEIERSLINDRWSSIDFIPGKGSSDSSQYYSYTDKNLSAGKFKYRLKQIDLNGNYKYYDLGNEVFIGIPEKFSLAQNYPNPFNPSTRIAYEIPVQDFVTLKIYNVLGKEISTLVNENQNAGYYNVDFNALGLASGIYFYTLETEIHKATMRMVLLK